MNNKTHPTPATEQGQAGILRIVGGTGFVNLASSFCAAVNGVLIARLLKPAGRGDYAAITSMFGLILVFFEVGLGAAVVFYVSHLGKKRAPEVIGTALLMLAPLALLGSVAALGASLIANGSDRQTASLLLPAAIIASFLGAPATFALQSLNLSLWNTVRLAQPMAFLAVTSWLEVAHYSPTLFEIILILCATIMLQNTLSWVLLKRAGVRRLSQARNMRRPLLSYGSQNLLSTAPNAMNARLDQLVMAYLIAPAALGNYAVAVSLSLMASPLVTAFGSVLFPRLASGSQSHRSVIPALKQAAFTAALGSAIVYILAPYIITPLYGSGFADAIHLLLPLVIGGSLMSMNQVIGDVLRGAGQPSVVARCEWVGALLTILLVPPVVHTWGTIGVALLSCCVYGTVFMLLAKNTYSRFAKDKI